MGARQDRGQQHWSFPYADAGRSKKDLVSQLEKVKGSLQQPKCQVYMNATAQAVGPSTPVEEIIKTLGEQLVSPVLWDQSMQQAIKDGCVPMMKRIDRKGWDNLCNVLA